MVWPRLAYVNVFVVLAICVQLAPAFVEDSHLTITPPCPLKLSVPLLLLAHTIVTGWEIIPPSGEGVTTIVALAVLEQPLAAVPVTV